MPFDLQLTKGQTINNQDLQTIFKCSPRGGMRRSLTTNSLVIISDHTRGFYKDRWENGVLHYTGMGLTGDQSLDFQQNKTLARSDSNGVAVFLFEVTEEGKYVYQGQVQLAKEPYQETQPDQDDQPRKVWMFPVQLVDKSNPALIDEETFQKVQETEEKKAALLSMDELKRRIELAPKKGGTREVISKQHDRNPYVSVYVKQRAGGICQLCQTPAPFEDKKKQPFLEVHHIAWLSKGGLDTVENTVALCPNCHRKMHILNLAVDRDLLAKKANLKL
jgi:5-methylcytosine-specific restriction enzyme A